MYKVYGPYKRKDGRQIVIHYNGTQRVTQSYPRYLMEEHLGRALNDWEHVDHIDDDFTNNHIDNLQLLSQPENNRKSSKPAKMREFMCSVCDDIFEIPERQYLNNQIKQGKAGPYCSKTCAGKVHN